MKMMHGHSDLLQIGFAVGEVWALIHKHRMEAAVALVHHNAKFVVLDGLALNDEIELLHS
jgi:hypothetical protein